MTRSELQDYGADEPGWRFIAQLARERFTGQADVGVDTRVELYAAEGRVYFAQKVDDPPLGARLVSTGVLTTEQFRNGSVKVGDTVSLARLFQRVPALDRDTVELMTEKLSNQVLESVSERPVGSVTLHPLRFHPSGIHQWHPDAGPAPEDDEPSPAMAALVQDVVAAVSGQVPVVPVVPTVTPAPVSDPASEPPVAPAEPTPDAVAFEVPFRVVTTPPEAEAALPTLSSLSGLTPLPTLGEVGTRMPTPTIVHQPGPLDTQGLPILGSVGTSFQPLAPTSAAVPPPPSANASPTPTPAPAPTASAPAALAPGAMLPPPTIGGPSPLDVPSPGAMMSAAAALPVPAEGETEEIWDMVDDLLGIPHDGATLVSAGGGDDKKGRGWLRGRRG